MRRLLSLIITIILLAVCSGCLLVPFGPGPGGGPSPGGGPGGGNDGGGGHR